MSVERSMKVKRIGNNEEGEGYSRWVMKQM